MYSSGYFIFLSDAKFKNHCIIIRLTGYKQTDNSPKMHFMKIENNLVCKNPTFYEALVSSHGTISLCDSSGHSQAFR